MSARRRVLLGGGGFLLRGGVGRTGRDDASDEATDQPADSGAAAIVVALPITAPDLLVTAGTAAATLAPCCNGAAIAVADSTITPAVAARTALRM